MENVSLVQNLPDHKVMVTVVQICVIEPNSFTNGDIAFHVKKGKFMTKQEDNVNSQEETSLPTFNQLHVENVSTDQLMVLNAMTAQTTLVPKTMVLNVLVTNVNRTKFSTSTELVLLALMVQDLTSCKEIVLRLSLTQCAVTDKSMLKL